MDKLTILTSEVEVSKSKPNVNAKIAILTDSENSKVRGLFLSQKSENVTDGNEEDHLTIEFDEKGRCLINSNYVDRYILDAIINFIK